MKLIIHENKDGNGWWPDGEHTTEKSQMLEGILAHKSGLAHKLPDNHPYKKAPPTNFEVIKHEN